MVLCSLASWSPAGGVTLLWVSGNWGWRISGHLSCFDHDFPGNRRLQKTESVQGLKKCHDKRPSKLACNENTKKTCWNMATLCQSLWIDDISVHFMHLHLTRAKVTSRWSPPQFVRELEDLERMTSDQNAAPFAIFPSPCPKLSAHLKSGQGDIL